MGFLGSVVDFASDTASSVVDTVADVGSDIAGGAGDLVEGAGDVATSVVDTGGGALSGACNALSDVVEPDWERINGFIGMADDATGGLIEDVPILGTGYQIAKHGGSVMEALDKGQSLSDALCSEAGKFVSDKLTDGVEFPIADKLINGLDNTAKALDAPDWMKDVTSVASGFTPSKMAENTMSILGRGINAMGGEALHGFDPSAPNADGAKLVDDVRSGEHGYPWQLYGDVLEMGKAAVDPDRDVIHAIDPQKSPMGRTMDRLMSPLL
jgi:hypothetical protein